MSLTLLVENNPKIESFYRLNLSIWLGLEIVPAHSLEEAVNTLRTRGAEFKLIIIRTVIKKDQSAQKLMTILPKLGVTIPVIAVGPGNLPSEVYGQISNSLLIKELIKTSAKALNITAKDMSAKLVPDYYPIPIEYFKVIKRPVCTVFIKNGDQYAQRFEKLKDFAPVELDHLIKEGTQTLYVDKFDRLEFTNNITSELMSTLESEDLSLDETISAGDKSMELLSKKILHLGVSEETVQLAKKNIAQMKKNARSSPKLNKLLDRLLANKASYLYLHTQILTFLCLHIVQNIDWGNPEQEDKISFIAFFHDIVLEDDIQGKIKSNAELKKADLPLAQKQLVEKHAQMAAEFVMKYPHAPMGADQIIRQHHGTLNGIGFSEQYTSNLSPMAMVFIVAEECTRIIMDTPEGTLDKSKMIQDLRAGFTTNRFQKIIDLLETLTL